MTFSRLGVRARTDGPTVDSRRAHRDEESSVERASRVRVRDSTRCRRAPRYLIPRLDESLAKSDANVNATGRDVGSRPVNENSGCRFAWREVFARCCVGSDASSTRRVRIRSAPSRALACQNSSAEAATSRALGGRSASGTGRSGIHRTIGGPTFSATHAAQSCAVRTAAITRSPASSIRFRESIETSYVRTSVASNITRLLDMSSTRMIVHCVLSPGDSDGCFADATIGV